MQHFSCFFNNFYVQNWFAAPIAVKASRTNLNYLQKIQNYNDKDIPAVASKAHHLWYLKNKLVPLAFILEISDGVSPCMKQKAVKALEKLGTERSGNSIQLNFQDISYHNKKKNIP